MMATAMGATRRGKPLSADNLEKLLAFGAAALLVTVLVALAKGHADWPRVPVIVWSHLATILVALALTPVMLLRPRGDRPHRTLGKIWVGAMFLTALLSFWVRQSNGSFSFIHIISLYVVVAAPMIWWSARHHRIAQHRGQVRGMVIGALLIAGFFTLPFGRMLGRWLFA